MTASVDVSLADHKAAIVRAASDKYNELRRQWLESRTPEQLACIEASKAVPYCPAKRCTIERESPSTIRRSIRPYSDIFLFRW